MGKRVHLPEMDLGANLATASAALPLAAAHDPSVDQDLCQESLYLDSTLGLCERSDHLPADQAAEDQTAAARDQKETSDRMKLSLQ